MNPCIEDVRAKLQQLVASLFEEIPEIRVGVVSHGDYCDGDRVIKILDLTNDQDKIQSFIKTAPRTGGGDFPECYELIIHEVGKLSWSESGGSLVLIGDDQPHDADYYRHAGRQALDWKIELQKLLDRNVKVFALQCLRTRSSHGGAVNDFWEGVAAMSGTPHMVLDDFQTSAATLGAIAVAATGDTELMRGFTTKVEKGTSGLVAAAAVTPGLYANMESLKAYTSTLTTAKDEIE